MISLTVTLEVEPERVEAFLELMRAHAAATRTEPGCRRFELHRRSERSDAFVLWEVHDDEAALQAHHASGHFARWKERGGGLLRTKDSLRCEVLDAG